ncbi:MULTISPECIES: tetratricopeptide repeat protein [Pseudomonas]|uniref:Tetratricopeptide repeat protein n=3 Tax=Pseudomonas nitroreducens/multiresinivorans group TaxID=627141 RepID=A0ABS0KJX0_PSENT|nr:MULTISPECIES: tetratricopeptide repeat protein [Pseudomonas]MBG6288373.1 tetratricopeptide repeat protein [Pseudomonas nitroreducens]MCE4070940.1 tetratricopeptide repeat protein [Pseudomonas nitritireducens]MCE4081177.1 tetratricopeptide repeat protein [Pseudomonas nitroreducens]MCJ1880004.1 tetratricopeptide repeat protein [Pseudomonas nitroreducens]MCJ1897650.1 tetratricopeptide repeat protein [Pseudomonas nitroreducens]
MMVPFRRSGPRPSSMNKSLALLTALLLLGGCQSLTQKNSDSASAEKDKAAAAQKDQKYGSFSEDTMFSLLTAELAGQRNRFDIALANYVEQAKETRDPGVAERAFRIAEYLGADQEALDTSLIWAKAAPDNLDAQRAAAIQLARTGQYDESMVYMEKVLNGQGDTHFDFLALSAAETDPDTRAGLLQSFDRLLKKYPDNGQLLFGKALLLQQDGRPQEALHLLEDNSASKHDVAPLLLRARLLQSMKRSDEALPLLKAGIKEHPDDKRVHLAYARLLVEQNRLEDAKAEFSALVEQFPDDDDLRFSLALVCLEAQAWDEAKVYLQELVERDSHVDSAHFNLGRLAEEQKDPETALKEYALVGPGNDFLPAQLRSTEILLDQKRYDDASRRLAETRDRQPDYAIQLYLIEAEGLSNRDQVDRAWSVIQQGLKQFPDDLNLLYTRSMLAEKRNDLAQMEQDLRLIIQREPDNAMALNALGYTLADRTTRYSEARDLIQKAHSLNPDDPAILDSLGWVNYRLGNLSEAETYLRKALERFPDHEVAAHLGEVLWAQGKQSEARKVWATALQSQPDSAVLRDTMLRLTGSGTL